jgi:tetraacyldisaccharide 4'-kinase
MSKRRLDRTAFLKIVRGESRGVVPAVARTILGLVAIPYGLVVDARNRAFDRGRRQVARAEVLVVSIGNITLGGTGKTPMVEWVARRFREENLRVAILSRGYGQKSGLNDEGMVLEQNLPDVPHLQGVERAELAKIAVEELESQVLVLDDGFQHRRLGRDLDIVLIDALNPFGGGRIFPRGLLREPIRSLKRADIVVLSRANLVNEERRKAIREEAEKQAGVLRWVEASHAPRDLIGEPDVSEPLERIPSKRVAAFCGLGNPDGFRKTLDALGAKLRGFSAFPDHYSYTRKDVDEIANWAAALDADLLLTTQKDLVKLRTNQIGRVPLRAVRIGLEVTEGRMILDEALASIVCATRLPN